MSKYPDIYEIVGSKTETGIQYFFVSEGEDDIIKAIQYTYVLDFQGRKVFNLGFGDYNSETDEVSDHFTSNNGDHYRVFHTVLSTIPEFFNTYGDVMMMVWGSDSKREFQENCKLSCIKRCKEDECKNSHRRINIYRNYVDKNFDLLEKDYCFFGGSIGADNQIVIESYQRGEKYDSVLVRKNS